MVITPVKIGCLYVASKHTSSLFGADPAISRFVERQKSA